MNDSFLLKSRKLIVGDGTVLEKAKVGVSEDKILEVTNGTPQHEYSEVIDLGDKVLMPGLIDAHVHVNCGPSMDPEVPSDEFQAIRGAENLRKTLKSGITSLADAGAPRGISFGVREAVNKGLIQGSRLFVCGDMLCMTGGFGKVSKARLEVTGAQQAREVTRKLLMRHDVDFVKIRVTGAITSPHSGPRHEQLTGDEIQASTEEAHKCGKLVHVHAYGEKGISNALTAGADAIVHGQSLSDAHIRVMKERGLFLLPTLSTYMCTMDHGVPELRQQLADTGIWDETEPNFKKALENGVTIAMGTDTGVPGVLFGENAQDLEYMVKWGMTPMQAIIAGTLNAASCIGVQDRIGTISPGKFADMLVLTEDPSEDILAIRNSLDKVILGGKIIH